MVLDRKLSVTVSNLIVGGGRREIQHATIARVSTCVRRKAILDGSLVIILTTNFNGRVDRHPEPLFEAVLGDSDGDSSRSRVFTFAVTAGVSEVQGGNVIEKPSDRN